MAGVLDQLPDTTALARLSASARAAVEVAGDGYAHFSSDDPASPLQPLTAAVGTVAEQAAVDVVGLIDALATSLEALRQGLPQGVVDFVAALEEAYASAHELVAGHPLAALVPEGSSLRDMGSRLLDAAVDTLGPRLEDLAGDVLGDDALREVADLVALVEGLRDDLPAHADELPRFVATTLVGFQPAVLEPLRGHVVATLDVVSDLDAAALAGLLDPLRDAAAQALAGLQAAVDALDPGVEAGYDAIVAALDALAGTVTAAATALAPFYDSVRQAVGAHGWQQVLPAFVDLLDAVDLAPQQLVDAVVGVTAELLDGLTERAAAAVESDEMVARVEGFAAGLRTALSQSAIGQLQARLVAALGDVRDTVAAVPLEQVRQAVVDMVGRVGAELDRLDLDGAAAQLEAAFAELEALVTRLVGEAGAAVAEGLDAVGDALEALPVDDLVAAVGQALDQVDAVITAASSGAEAHLDGLREQLRRLEEVSFRPAGDVVVGEIDEIRARLEKMSPNALNSTEQLAVRAAIGLYEALDLEGTVVREVTDAFDALQEGVLRVLAEVEGALQRLRRAFSELDPAQLLDPVTGAFARVDGALGRLDAGSLLAPVRAEVAAVETRLAALSPGSLLAPLSGPYDTVVAAVAALDPTRWGAALEDLHSQLAALVDRVDVGPLFARLDERRTSLLATARQTLTSGLEQLELPPPLDGWFATVRVLLDEVTALLFSDPGEGLRQLAARVTDDFALSSLYEPLENAFDELLSTLQQLPTGPLLEAATEVRDGIVTVLDLLEPERLLARLRAAHRRLVEAAPTAAVVALPQLAAVQAAFSAKVDAAVSLPAGKVARVRARFDAVATVLDASRPASPLAPLTRGHERVLTALREALDGLDVDAAQREWTRVRAQLDELLPAALLDPGPLTVPRVIAACETWRPSTRAQPLDAKVQAFLDTLAPLAARLDAALEQFAGDLGVAFRLVDPVALGGAVEEIVDAVRAQVDALAPGPVLETLRDEVWAPVATAVAALDPAQLAARLDAAYAAARDAVAAQLAGLLDAVEQLLAQHLQRARASVAAVQRDVQESLQDTAAAVAGLLSRVDDLVFVELLARLRTVLDNLDTSFDAEVARVVAAFDAMLAAAPTGQRAAGAGAAT